jgi:RES domain-containing protein
MLHDRELLDRLAAFTPIRFEGEVFRTTRRGLNPLAASRSGGRWMVPDEAQTLYTSCERDGAIAEVVYHWRQLTPLPSKPLVVHTLDVRTQKSLRLGRAELVDLGVDWGSYGTVASRLTQAIGAAIAHLEYDGLIAPSARWSCDNVILFPLNHEGMEDTLVARHAEDVDWQEWMRKNAPTGS